MIYSFYLHLSSLPSSLFAPADEYLPVYINISVQLLQYGSTTLLWDPDLLLVMEAVEKRGLKDLSDETAQALRQFLRQVYSRGTVDT